MNLPSPGRPAPDVIVVGGGVIGLSCAWRLAQGGLSVELVEAERCGGGSTHAALGALVPSVSTRRNALTALQRASLQIYPDFCAELEEYSADALYERRGRLELLRTAGRRENADHEVARTRDLWDDVNGEPPQEVISASELAALEPQLRHVEHGAIHCRITAQVHVDALVAALRQACSNAGVRIVEQTPVLDVAVENGRVHGVRVGDGLRPGGRVLLTAGAHVATLPTVTESTLTEPARGQSLTFRVERPLFDRLVRYGAVYLLRRDAHTVVVGATTEHEAGFDRRATEEAGRLLRDGAIDLFPDLAAAEVNEHRVGLRPSSVDLRPYLGPVTAVDGLFVAAGHYKIGIAMAPISASVLAQVLLTGTCEHDLAPFAPR